MRNLNINDILEKHFLYAEDYALLRTQIKEAKQALYDLLDKELIGEDGQVNGYSKPDGRVSVDLTQSYYNSLRATQRKKLKELFKGE